MLKPSLDELTRHVDSKYALVVAAAKRARELMDGAPALVTTDARKPVTIALEEIAHDRLEIVLPPAGLK
ncbi:MAG: DNA-directed RNA polymerase subunit omega [Actinomycetia bacterium]|nr:DNA-directed RNA polymerase subunit omega [Actinomycetes bacterium]